MRFLNGKGLVVNVVLCISVLAGAASVPAAAAPNKPQPGFEKAWAQYEAARAASAEAGAGMMGLHPRDLTLMALNIFESYPADPRRWAAALEIIQASDSFAYAKDGGPLDLENFDREKTAWDTEGRAAWNAYVKTLYEQMLANPQVPQDTIKTAVYSYFQRQVMTVNLPPTELIPTVDEYTRRFPDDPALAEMEGLMYMRLLGDGKNGEVINKRIEALLKSPNEAVRKFAEAKMLVKLGRGKPLDMKFTAVDGREVDLEKLRGKVVLIDFWATWCGPCMAEVPHLRKLYSQYQKQGFEIIGVSADEAPAGDKPEPGNKSARELVAFMKEHGMSWPSHYDGKVMNNELVLKYAVKALPTKYLLDKNGLLVAINPSGQGLEARIKELLGGNGGAQSAGGDVGESISSGGTAPADTGRTAPADTGRTAAPDTGRTAAPDTGRAARADTGRTAAADSGTAALATGGSATLEAGPLNPTLKIGDPAPKLDVLAWIKGNPVQSFKPGHVYVVDFWATWCVPCIEGMPHLSALQKKYADKLTVIGVSVREGGHGAKVPDVSAVKKFVEKKGDVMDYTVAMDDPARNAVFDAWMTAAGVYGIPAAFVVDGQGKVVWVGYPNGEWQQAFDQAIELAVSGKSDLEAARAIQDQVNERTYMQQQMR